MLAKNTKKIFNKIDKFNLLENTVKMNTKFYATVGVGEMKIFEDFTGNSLGFKVFMTLCTTPVL